MDFNHIRIQPFLILFVTVLSIYYIVQTYKHIKSESSRILNSPNHKLHNETDLTQHKTPTSVTVFSLKSKLNQESNLQRNRTSFTRPKNVFVFYNRVPKCGSTTMNNLLRTNSKRLDFIFNQKYKNPPILKPSKGEIKSLESWIEDTLQNRNTVYSRHIFYMDTSKFGTQVIYMNQLRDPVDRFISGYYWLRDGVRNHYDRDSKENKTALDQWLNKPIENCVWDSSDQECNDFSVNRTLSRVNPGSVKPWNKVMASSVPYFCGMDDFCADANSDKAVNQAIANMDLHYLVVGILENIEMSIKVFKHFLPEIFKGTRTSDFQHKIPGPERGKIVKHQERRKKLSTEARKVMAERMPGDYKLYKHAVSRLQEQYSQIN